MLAWGMGQAWEKVVLRAALLEVTLMSLGPQGICKVHRLEKWSGGYGREAEPQSPQYVSQSRCVAGENKVYPPQPCISAGKTPVSGRALPLGERCSDWNQGS